MIHATVIGWHWTITPVTTSKGPAIIPIAIFNNRKVNIANTRHNIHTFRIVTSHIVLCTYLFRSWAYAYNTLYTMYIVRYIYGPTKYAFRDVISVRFM